MTKRKELTERIFADFSSQITAEIYWKLFIFREYSHPKQRAKPKYIKSRILKESKNDDIIQRFPKISKESLMEEASKYMPSNNEKINKTLKYTRIQDLPSLLGISNINKLFYSPYVFGFYSFEWTDEIYSILMQKYFQSSEYSLELAKAVPADSLELLTYYLTDPKYSFSYVYTDIQTYPVSKLDESAQPSRQYTRTAFFILPEIDEIKGEKCIHINMKYTSWGHKKGGLNFSDYINKVWVGKKKKTKERYPVLFIFLPKNNRDLNFKLDDSIQYPYSLFLFKNYAELIKKLENIHFLDDKFTTRKIECLKMLKALNRCKHEIFNYRLKDFKRIDDYKFKLENIFKRTLKETYCTEKIPPLSEKN